MNEEKSKAKEGKKTRKGEVLKKMSEGKTKEKNGNANMKEGDKTRKGDFSPCFKRSKQQEEMTTGKEREEMKETSRKNYELGTQYHRNHWNNHLA